MIHPSYVELMKVVNNNVEIGEEPVVNSRYSIVMLQQSVHARLLMVQNHLSHALSAISHYLLL